MLLLTPPPGHSSKPRGLLWQVWGGLATARHTPTQDVAPVGLVTGAFPTNASALGQLPRSSR